MDSLILEIDFCHVIHAVAHFGLHYVVREHGVEKRAFKCYAVLLHNEHVVLHILPHLFDSGGGEEGTEDVDTAVCFLTLGRDGHVISSAGRRGETHAHESGIKGVERGGFGVESHACVFQKFFHERLSGIVGVDKLIRVGHVGKRFERSLKEVQLGGRCCLGLCKKILLGGSCVYGIPKEVELYGHSEGGSGSRFFLRLRCGRRSAEEALT